MQAQHLGEHERGSAIVVEGRQQYVEVDPAAPVGDAPRDATGRSRGPEHLVVETAAAYGATGVVGAGPAGDREEPTARRALGPVAVQGADRPLIGLLSEIVGGALVAQIPAQTPHVGLGLGHEPFERDAIAVAGCNEQIREPIHGTIVARSSPVHTVTDVRADLADGRNCSASPDDLHAMEEGTNASSECPQVRELISSLADGEATSDDREAVAHHVETCSGCQTFSLAVARLDRQIRIRPAEPVPNLVAAVTARARPARLGRGGWMRPALAWVAVVMFVQSVPMLLFGDVVGVDVHYARHLGAFGTALAIGFAYAAWKPHRAFGLLPFTAALVATTIVSLVADIVSGTRTPLAELIHLSEVIGLTLLWMIAGSPGWGRASRRPSRLSRLDPIQ